jgi:hypothetical protein
MSFKFKQFVVMSTLCLLVTEDVFSRPDYYTAGFYTRGSDAAFYMDQGGVLDPFYIPAKNWALFPRVTLAYTQDDDFFMIQGNGSTRSSLNLIPGALLIYGRPEHNHLYADTSVSVPLSQSGSTSEDGMNYVITLGGVKKTGKTQVYGRLGHRRSESEDTVIGTRVINQDYVGDIGVEYRISSKSGVGLNGSVELNEFGNAGYLNYNRYYGAGRFYHQLTEKSQWFLQGGIGRDDLASAQKGVYSDALFYDVSVGMRGKPGPKTTVSGRVGYQKRMYDDATISDVSSWIANLGIENTPFGFSTFSAELLATIRPDVTAAGDSVVNKRLTVGVNRRLFSERLRGDASVLFGMADHYGPGGRSQDAYRGFNLGIDWWTRWNMSIGAAYSYTERWSVTGGGPVYEYGQWTLRMSWNY